MISTKTAMQDVADIAAEQRDEMEITPLTLDQLDMIGGGEASVVTG